MWLDNLRKMKESSGLTTKEISRLSGLPEPTLEKLFAGSTKDPKLGTIRQLVHFFGCTLDDLEDPSAASSPHLAEPPLTHRESQLIQKYRLLAVPDKQLVDDVLEAACRHTAQALRPGDAGGPAYLK